MRKAMLYSTRAWDAVHSKGSRVNEPPCPTPRQTSGSRCRASAHLFFMRRHGETTHITSRIRRSVVPHHRGDAKWPTLGSQRRDFTSTATGHVAAIAGTPAPARSILPARASKYRLSLHHSTAIGRMNIRSDIRQRASRTHGPCPATEHSGTCDGRKLRLASC
jgi:hypothetical protein